MGCPARRLCLWILARASGIDAEREQLRSLVREAIATRIPEAIAFTNTVKFDRTPGEVALQGDSASVVLGERVRRLSGRVPRLMGSTTDPQTATEGVISMTLRVPRRC